VGKKLDHFKKSTTPVRHHAEKRSIYQNAVLYPEQDWYFK